MSSAKSTRRITTDDLRTLQRDVYSSASHRAAEAIIESAHRAGIDPQSSPILSAILRWDGHYTTDSAGAAAYQRLLDSLLDELYKSRYATPIIRTMRSGAYVHDFVREDLASPASESAFRRALDHASIDYDPAQTWGDVHRLAIAHPLSNIPVLGSRYTFDNIPSAGTTTTVHKAAHSINGGRHQVTFGANSRLICDLSDLDANLVVLLGGQDGHLGSEHFIDQVPLWQSGEMIPLPLSREGQLARTVRTVELVPTSTVREAAR